MANSGGAEWDATGVSIGRQLESREIVQGIANRVLEVANEELGQSGSSGGLVGRVGGAALLAQLLHSLCPCERTLGIVEKCIAELSRDTRGRSPALFGGAIGTLWLLLQTEDICQGRVDIGPIAEPLIARLRAAWGGGYELASGLVGFGVLGVEIADRHADDRLLCLVIERLYEMSLRDGIVQPLHTPQRYMDYKMRSRFPDGVVDLGMAHGLGGAIGILVGACRRDIHRDLCEKMLSVFVPYCLSRLVCTDMGLCLPCRAPDSAVTGRRLAWCYNELGMMVAIEAAGQVCGRRDWRERSMQVVHATIGTAIEDSGMLDLCLCHGVAGVAHLYRLLAYRTGDLGCAGEARRWFAIVLDMCRAPDAPWNIDMSARRHPSTAVVYYERDYGLLTGATGVALVLLSDAYGTSSCVNRIMALF